MPDKQLISALLAAGLAGIMQISVVLVLAMKMRPLQYLGAFLLSTITGGGLTVLLQEQAHWSPFLAGVFGAFSGALPAVIVPLIIMRVAFKRLGIESNDITQLFNVIRGMQTDGLAPVSVPAVTPEIVAPEPEEVGKDGSADR
ncbi:hypothetical protein ACFFLM_19090 [Deinococcus oregonensis]|uniref:Uncharacterized protein n=1 Tax=Deinococcus oregonensis TaxID=1805970 RepID=A0ABV6B2U6_9DEIO